MDFKKSIECYFVLLRSHFTTTKPKLLESEVKIPVLQSLRQQSWQQAGREPRTGRQDPERNRELKNIN